MKRVSFILVTFLLFLCQAIDAQKVLLAGKVVDAESDKPIEYASILLSEKGLWAISNEKGAFAIKEVTTGKTSLTVQCLGYQKRTLHIDLNRNVTRHWTINRF